MGICKGQIFDVIIMDQHMDSAGGVLLGTDTVGQLRKRKIDSVIVGCSGIDIDELFMNHGADWVMKKPTPPNNVIVRQLRQPLVLRKKKIPFYRLQAHQIRKRLANDWWNRFNRHLIPRKLRSERLRTLHLHDL